MMKEQIAQLAIALQAIRTAMELEDKEGAEVCVEKIGLAEDAVLAAIEASLHCERTYRQQ